MNEKMTPEELEQFIHRELRALPARKAPAGFETRLQAAVEARLAVGARSPEQLEQFIHQNLRALPARKAPRSLESRVLAAIEQQATVAWYHKSWAYWPGAVRAAFLALGTGISGAAITAFYLLSQGADFSSLATATSDRLAGVTALLRVFTWIVSYTTETVAAIPPLWLYGGLAFVAALYAAFFGLGAAAYRTLYRNN